MASSTIKAPSIIDKGTISIGGDFTSIGNWIKANFVPSKWIIARVNVTSSGYFGMSSVGIVACLSSASYGWGWIQSDNSNVMVFFRLAMNFQFYHPTLTEVS